MHLSELGSLASTLGDWVSNAVELSTGPAAQLKSWIVERFGQNGLIAACVIAGGIALYIFVQIVKVIFAIIKFVVVPAIVLALLATLVLPVTFVSALGVTAAACSVFLLFKG